MTTDPFAAWGEGLMRSWTEQLEDDVETKDVERLAGRMEATYSKWNNPPSPELPDGARVLLEAAIALRTLSALLETERRRSEGLREALAAIERGDDSRDGMQGDIARAALEDTE